MTHYALLPNELVLGTPPDYTLHRLLSKRCRVLRGGCRSPWVSLHPPSRPSRAFYRVAALVAVTTVAFLVYICSALIAGPLSKWPVGRRLGSGHSSEVAGHSSEVTPGDDRGTTQPCVFEKLPAYSKTELNANLPVDSKRPTSHKALGVSLPISSEERPEHAAGRKESTPEGFDSTVQQRARSGKRKLQFSVSEQKQSEPKRQTKAAKVQSQEQLPNCASNFHQNSEHSSQEGKENPKDVHHTVQTQMTSSPPNNAGPSLQGSPQLSGLTGSSRDVLKNMGSPESCRILRSLDIYLERLLEEGDGVHFEASWLDPNAGMPRSSHFDGNINLPPPGQSHSYPEESDNAAFPGAPIYQGGFVAGTGADYLSARFSPEDVTTVDAWLDGLPAHTQDDISAFSSISQEPPKSGTYALGGVVGDMAGSKAAGQPYFFTRTNTLPSEQPVGCMNALSLEDKLPKIRLCTLPACDTLEPSEAVTKDSQQSSSSLVSASPSFALHGNHVRTPQNNLAGAKLKTSPLHSTTKLPSGNPFKGSLRVSLPVYPQHPKAPLQEESASHAKASSTISSADAAVKSSATRLLPQNVVETGRQRRSRVLLQAPSSKCAADPQQAPAIHRSIEVAQCNAKTTNCSGDAVAGRPSQVSTKKMHMSAEASTSKQGTASSQRREIAASISLRVVPTPPGGSHLVLRHIEPPSLATQPSDLEVVIPPALHPSAAEESACAADEPPDRDLRNHPFYRLPVVTPGISDKHFDKAAADAMSYVRRRPMHSIIVIKDLLKKRELSKHQFEIMIRETERLYGFAMCNLPLVLPYSQPARLAWTLGRAFLLLDTLYCAVQVLGPNAKSAEWWPKMMEHLSPLMVTSVSIGNNRSASCKYIDICRRLLIALRTYRTGFRPSAEVVVGLKRSLFCDLGIFKQTAVSWERWRRDELSWKYSTKC